MTVGSAKRVRSQPALEILGAAGHVTGSRFLLHFGAHRVLVDCGLVQEPDLEERNREPFPFVPREVDGVLLTHAHLDHSGLLPRLVHHGFRGQIWSTPATRELAAILLMDAARLNQEEATFRRRHTRPRGQRASPAPLYGVGDVRATLRQFATLEYDRRFTIAPDAFATFQDAGHILGSASILVELPSERGVVRVLFSGDLGRPDRPILHDPTPPPPADYVVVESTYGDRVHQLVDVEEQMARVINETVARGGNVIIPSFAVERTQEVLLHLRHLIEAGQIPPLLTFLDSPMGAAVTRLFRRYPQLLDPDIAAGFGRHRSPFEFPSLQIIDTVEASKAINSVRGSVVIIAGAGMCNGGRVVHHLTHNLGRPESTVLMVGYQAPGTVGRALVDGAPVVYLFGEPHPVRARVEELSALSAHADQEGIAAWLAAMPTRPRRVIVVHGEQHASEALRDYLVTRGGWDVEVPEYATRIALA